MNLKVGRAVLCAPTAATTSSSTAKDGAHGVTRPTSAGRFMAPMHSRSWMSQLPMNRSFFRQVLDCGDGVREVTALALAALKIPKLAADTATPTQSGDSEDSVAAVQDARAPTRAALGSWSGCN